LRLTHAFLVLSPVSAETEAKGSIMQKDKDRSGRNSENDRDRNMRQRTWMPSHKTGRGGGNRE
jgi:hypothetical protein